MATYTEKELRDLVTKGYATGMHPDAGHYIGTDADDRLCGCAQGAICVGLGHTSDDYAGFSGILAEIGRSTAWSFGVDDGFAGVGLQASVDGMCFLYRHKIEDFKAGHRFGAWARKKFKPL